MSNLLLNTQFAIISLLLLINISHVHARQCIRVSGNRVVCRGLSTGARVGIAIGVFVLAMVLLTLLCCWRRRRLHRRNLAYLSDPNGQPQVSQTQNQTQPPLPAYPPQAYGQHNNPQYAPPPGPPPV